MVAGRVSIRRGLALLVIIMPVVRASWFFLARGIVNRGRRPAICRPGGAMRRRVALIAWRRCSEIRCIWPFEGLWCRGRARPRVVHVFFDTECS